MKKIFYIADPEILEIPVVECHEPLVDVRDHTTLAYGPPPESPLTAECYTKIRTTVFDKLCQAQKDLPHGWRFLLYEGYRSLTVQKMLFDLEYKRTVSRFPDATPAIVFHETTRLISPVTNFDGSANIPPHNTGAAIDIEIITAEGQRLDMGMEAKDWCTLPPELSMTDCQDISVEARRNRLYLLELMTQHGFVNYPMEWWHYSYGDRYWAYRQNIPHAIYGALNL